MNRDHPSHPAARARSPRTVVLLGVVMASLVGCSTGGGEGQDSVVALEEARAEAAAELAEVQEALDRQVEAADAQKAQAQAAAQQAPKPAAAAVAVKPAAAPKTAPARATSRTVAAPRAEGATRVHAPRPAAVTRPAQRTTGRSSRTATAGSGGAGKRATAPVAPRKPVAAGPSRAAAAPKPPGPEAAKATTQPQGAVSSTDDLLILVAGGGTSSSPGDASVAAVCQPQDFQTGDRVLLTTDAGLLVREAVLPACEPEVVADPATGAAPSSPRFSVTLPEIPWREGDAWVLQIGSRQWPVMASTLSEYGWSIAVTAEGGVVAGPVERHCREQELPEAPAWAVTLAENASAKPSTAPASTGSPSCSAGSSPVSAGAAAAAQ